MQKNREIWISTYIGDWMDELKLEEISHDKEVMEAFPTEIAHTGGYPVVCWKYNLPLGLRLCRTHLHLSADKERCM